MNKYCLGLLFNCDETGVLLLSKRSTDTYNPGLWNGVGGKVEKGEDGVCAMVRETEEETGLLVPENEWRLLGVISDYDIFHVDVFAARADISSARQTTDEIIKIFDRETAKDLDFAASVKDVLLTWLEGGSLLPESPSPPRP